MKQMCLDCKCKSVCKIVDAIKAFSDIAVLDVTECYVKDEDPQQQAPTLAEPVLQPVKNYKNLRSLREPIGAPKMPSLESPSPVAIKELDNDSSTNFMKATRQCKTCDGIAFDGDITACPKCGVETCDSCGTEDAETGKRLCEKCWGEE